MKIARMEDYEISHTYSLYREVQNANIFEEYTSFALFILKNFKNNFSQ